VSGLRETLLVVAAFLALGLSAAGLERAATRSGPPYLRSMESAQQRSDTPRPAIWLVDGFNVLCTALLGGRDRAGWWGEERRAELLARAAQLAEPEAEVWVVFDGASPPPETPARGRVRAVFAPSADTWLLERLRERPPPGGAVVVTADRRLAERARRRGARIVTPHEFLASCPEPPGPASTS
jgi:hypothetical protein